jgi:hypothetical protein
MTEEPRDPAPPSGTSAPAPELNRTDRREKAAGDVLRTFIRDAHVSRFGPVVHGQDAVAIQLTITVRPAENWALAFDPPLADQIAHQLQDAQADRGAARKGRAYCFRCASSLCEHSLPPSALHVFAGYSPTGQPEWEEFAQTLIAARDERVDRLFSDRPTVLARVRLGRELRDRQLTSFGRASKTYAILGQVAVGYFPLRLPGPARGLPPEKLALTFQAVETRDAAGRLSLMLNMLGLHPEGTSLEDALSGESTWGSAVYRAREIASRDLENLERLAAQARDGGKSEEALAALKKIPGILMRLAESLERGDRQMARRTRHAETRRADDRPVHKALDDALAARPDALFSDERTAGIVVCGPQGRAHIFNREGRHITTFSLKPEAVDYRLRTERWKRLPPDESAAFKARILPLAEGAAPAEPDSLKLKQNDGS